MQCKNCGRDVKSDFKYCPYCANRLIHDFEDQFSDLNPPYVMPDLREEESDDAAAFLYGRARVISDEEDTFFKEKAPDISAEQPDDPPPHVPQDRPRPYEVYRPEPLGGLSFTAPCESFDTVSDIEPPHNDFRVNLPGDLADLEEPLPEEFASPPDDFRVNLPDDLADLEEPLPEEFASPPDDFRVNLPDDFADLEEPLPKEFASPHNEERPMHASGRLEWESEDSGGEASSSAQRMEDAPYVRMQPDMGTAKPTPPTPSARSVSETGPGILIKLLLIFFMISLGILAAFVLYRFGGGFFHAAERLELASSAIGCIVKMASVAL